MNILVINAGSSSLKYQLLNPETQQVLAKGLCERIGIDGKFTYKPQMEGKQVLDAIDIAMPTHSEAIQAVLDALVDKDNGVIGSMKEIDAVGHRVVHGGEKFAKSVVITDEVMHAIEECNPLAPLHNPANIIGIKACQQLLPGVQSSVEATLLAKMGERGQLGTKVYIDGPLALDVAINKAAAATKKLDNPVVGDADCLVFPNIDAGNVFFKSCTKFGGAELAAMVMGAKVPCVLTSRGDSKKTKMYSIALACLSAK